MQQWKTISLSSCYTAAVFQYVMIRVDQSEITHHDGNQPDRQALAISQALAIRMFSATSIRDCSPRCELPRADGRLLPASDSKQYAGGVSTAFLIPAT
ncbi:MAG: hypothetical protein CBB71_22100 [Rhodopirellula sp. TMED11]|nr:MAG: hypothetical protein CBB71_22100 [Rhodopirellula sp. TMED11]